MRRNMALMTQMECEVGQTLSVEENLSAHEQIEQLKKQILTLEKQARAEKQPKKKFELVQRINKLRKG